MCLNAIAISFGWMATTWPGESPTNADFITYWRALRGSVPPRLCCRSSRHGKIHESSVEQSSKRKSRCPFATSEWISRLVTFLSFYFVNFSFFFFFGENSCQNDESNNCILNIMDWLKVILAWKLFIQFHIFCQCIWRILIEKNGKKTYINLEEAKNFELPTFFLLQLINSSWLISLKSNR